MMDGMMRGPSGEGPEVIEYLKTPPSREKLKITVQPD